jgi:hypothetical protein
LLWPSKPTAKYPGTPDGRLPKEMQTVYDPLTVLTFVAASTQKVQLGTSVLLALYCNPVIMAKIGATLDQLSGGRFIFGVGVGWNADEFTAVGQPVGKRGRMTQRVSTCCEDAVDCEGTEFFRQVFSYSAWCVSTQAVTEATSADLDWWFGACHTAAHSEVWHWLASDDTLNADGNGRRT